MIYYVKANDNFLYCSINDDTTLLQTRTKQLLLLARIREKSGHLNSSLATLKEARDNQYRLQNRIVVEQSSSVFEQNAILAKYDAQLIIDLIDILSTKKLIFNIFFFRICILMAEQSIALRDSHQAITHYQEALKYSQDDIKVITPLARLYLQVNNVVDCKAMCTKILKLDPNNEAASVMMADISFRGVNIQFHFDRNSNN